MSSAAIRRSSPPMRTRSARRSASSSAAVSAVSPGRRDGQLALGEVADAAQQVVQRVGAAAALAPELLLDLLEGVGVEQVAQLVGAGELAQQVAVERERGDPALGGRGVVLVEVLRDVFEVERGRERRCGLRLDGHELAAAVAQARRAARAARRGRSGRRAARGRSRAGSGTSRSARRPPAATARAAAAARAACAARAAGAGSAAPARRSRGSGRRTATSRRARRRRDPRCGPGRSRRARRAAGRRRRGGAG